jgi:hypothetical protein
MKMLLTSRSELRWIAIAVPAVFLGHWILVGLGPRLLTLLPSSLRAVLNLL